MHVFILFSLSLPPRPFILFFARGETLCVVYLREQLDRLWVGMTVDIAKTARFRGWGPEMVTFYRPTRRIEDQGERTRARFWIVEGPKADLGRGYDCGRD